MYRDCHELILFPQKGYCKVLRHFIWNFFKEFPSRMRKTWISQIISKVMRTLHLFDCDPSERIFRFGAVKLCKILYISVDLFRFCLSCYVTQPRDARTSAELISSFAPAISRAILGFLRFVFQKSTAVFP